MMSLKILLPDKALLVVRDLGLLGGGGKKKKKKERERERERDRFSSERVP